MELIYEKISDYTVVDLETTGLDPSQNEIIEIGALKVRNSEIAEVYHSYVKPSVPIPPFITELTHISNDTVKDAPAIDVIIDALVEFLGKDVLVGHNLGFDVRFINSALSNGSLACVQYADTMHLSKKLLKGLPHHRLVDLVEYFGIEVDRVHNALDDCRATKIVYDRLYAWQERVESGELDLFDAAFSNKVVCFSGRLRQLPHVDALRGVIKQGGFVVDKMSSKVDYLVLTDACLDDAKRSCYSLKHLKALELMTLGVDIAILTEEQFKQFLQNKR